MKILNIIRSETDKNADYFMEKFATDNESKTIELNADTTDWDSLIDDIFESDKVVCWW